MPVGSRLRGRIALVGLLGAIGVAHAGFDEDYVAAVKALNQGRSADAEKYFRSAFDSQPNPIDKINIDGNWQPYIPLHWLGVIAASRGDCKTAGDLWSGQANRRMIARLNLVRLQEQQQLGTCKPAEAAVPAPAPAKTEAPAAAPVPVTPEPTPAKPQPPEALVQALQNFLAGRYAAAARIDPNALGEPRAKFHAYVIRSAARFMLANTGADANALDAARTDARAARAIDARATLDAATFPPRFLAFYAQAQ